MKAAQGRPDAVAASIDWLAAQYDRHGQQVYSLALHMVSDQQEAEEVVVDTFLALHRAGCRGADGIEDHLLRCARNLAVLRLNLRSSRS